MGIVKSKNHIYQFLDIFRMFPDTVNWRKTRGGKSRKNDLGSYNVEIEILES
jgi:hypothetical protein